MKDFILTLVVFFVLFKILSSFRSSKPVNDGSKEKKDIYNDKGTRVEYRDEKGGGDDDFVDYEEIKDEDPKK
jgi:hypothetical protein